ncbi:hypothetical protein OF83DRAFT_424958 [Amylostereum chailletii]|nr:hypothetical protein OF83DRAFT_424958 [Amylostereum chailletii]
MSPPGKTLARLNDATLGAFARVPPSEPLDHLLRYLSTWSGSDKLFMVIQYGAKVLIPILQLRARIQHRAGLRAEPVSKAAPSLSKLVSIISDARALWGMWGILPIIQWLIALERSPPPTRRLLTIERTQGWAMLAFYPLDHLYYLITHNIIPAAIPVPFTRSLSSDALEPRTKTSAPDSRQVNINPTRLTLWSTRFWAIYVILQIAHLREDRILLAKRQKALGKDKVHVQERQELKRRWDAWYNELFVNLAYLPLTIHWCVLIPLHVVCILMVEDSRSGLWRAG